MSLRSMPVLSRLGFTLGNMWKVEPPSCSVILVFCYFWVPVKGFFEGAEPSSFEIHFFSNGI